MFLTIDPRALPWAGMLRPIGADRAVGTMQVIEEEERIQPAKDLDAATKRGEDLGLTDGEKALTPHRSRSVGLRPSLLLLLGSGREAVWLAAEHLGGSGEGEGGHDLIIWSANGTAHARIKVRMHPHFSLCRRR